jgi:hypothetical protein
MIKINLSLLLKFIKLSSLFLFCLAVVIIYSIYDKTLKVCKESNNSLAVEKQNLTLENASLSAKIKLLLPVPKPTPTLKIIKK